MTCWTERLRALTNCTPSARCSPRSWLVPLLIYKCVLTLPMCHRRTNTTSCLTSDQPCYTCSVSRNNNKKKKRYSFEKRLTILHPSQDTHFPPIGRVIMPRPAMCHTSSLQTPNDKEQALQVAVSFSNFPFHFLLYTICFCRNPFSLNFITFGITESS